MSCNLIRLARRGAVFAIAALLIGCDETTMPATMPDTPVAVAADNTANATADAKSFVR